MPTLPIDPALCVEALRLVKEHGSTYSASKATGIPRGTLQNRVRRAAAVGVTAESVIVPAEKHTPELLLRALRVGDFTLDELATRIGATRGQTLDLLDRVRDSGYSVRQHGDAYHLDRLPQTSVAGGWPMLEYFSDEDGDYRFGACGDSHLGSKYARLDVLTDLYRRYAELGVDRVFHTGNWIDGERRFNKHDLLIHGLGPQVRYLVENYPKAKGITTYAVAGDDHEGWYAQDMGLDIGRFAETAMREAGREDWVNLGYIEADVALVHAKTGERSILRVAHPGGGCFDGNAEILTRTRGWVPFADLTLFDEVATMRQADHMFEWQRPTHVTDELYSGKMYRFKNRTMGCLVTPNHRFMVRDYRALTRDAERAVVGYSMPQKANPQTVARGWNILSAEEIAEDYSRQRFQFPTVCGGWEGEYSPTVTIPHRAPRKYASTPITQVPDMAVEDAAELLGWYASEGSVHKDGKQATISQELRVNPENHAQIVELFERLRIPYRAHTRGVRACSVVLVEWLSEQCGVGSANKKLPEWLKNQPARVLEFALDALLKGDGWHNGASFGYSTISRQLADDISEIAQKCGYGVSMRNVGKTWFLGVRVVQNTPTLNQPPTVEDYAGRVHCCTVPNGMIYVRSHGSCFWSHNSSYATSYTAQKYVESLEGGDKPAVVLLGHYHKGELLLTRNVWTVQTLCTQDQTPFARKKRLEFAVGGVALKLHQERDGAISECDVKFMRYFNRGYYTDRNGRWNHDGPVNLPTRG